MESQTQRMQADTTHGKDLIYLTVYPEEYDPDLQYPLVIMLHGYGASMYDLADLARLIDTKGYIYVCPNAPVPVQIAQGVLGFAWNVPGKDDPAGALRSEQKLDGFCQEVMEKHSVAPGQAVLLGFSQGGGLTYRYGLSHPSLFAGLAALSCSIRDPDEMRQRLPGERRQPIFIAHGLHDNVERARASREFLEAEGYIPKYMEYNMGHEINQDVMNDLVPWVRSILPPLQRTV